MNGREEYITTQITQRKGAAKKKKEAQRKEGGSCVARRGWGFPSSNEGSLPPGTLSRPILCIFHPKTSRRLIRAQLLDPLSTNSL